MTATEPKNPLSQAEPWDLIAAGYAAETHDVLGAFSERAIAMVRAPRSAVAIDVAAGPGTLALRLAPDVAEVHAVDFSEPMLAELRRAAMARGLSNIETRAADGQELPYPANTFDAGFSMFGLMFFPDRARGFAELLRVIKPGAAVVVSSWAPAEESSLMTSFFGGLRVMDPEWQAPQRNLLSLESEERFAAEMKEAGFADVTVLPQVHTFGVPSGADLWRSMERSNVALLLARRRLGDAVWTERSGAAIAHLESEVERHGHRLSTKALLGYGTKR